MTTTIDITAELIRDTAPLYFSPRNQLRRELGKFETVYCGGVEGGTVRDESGKCFDWWPTEEVLRGGFRKLCIVPAR